jgi:hypothetical protein
MPRCNENIIYNMAKIYSEKPLATCKMSPKKETISFLISYSKALKIVKSGRMTFECIAN